MTTNKQDQDFIDYLMPGDLLQDAIEWIRNNLEPDDVFFGIQLDSWARGNDYKKDLERQ